MPLSNKSGNTSPLMRFSQNAIPTVHGEHFSETSMGTIGFTRGKFAVSTPQEADRERLTAALCMAHKSQMAPLRGETILLEPTPQNILALVTTKFTFRGKAWSRALDVLVPLAFGV